MKKKIQPNPSSYSRPPDFSRVSPILLDCSSAVYTYIYTRNQRLPRFRRRCVAASGRKNRPVLFSLLLRAPPRVSLLRAATACCCCSASRQLSQCTYVVGGARERKSACRCCTTLLYYIRTNDAASAAGSTLCSEYMIYLIFGPSCQLAASVCVCVLYSRSCRS